MSPPGLTQVAVRTMQPLLQILMRRAIMVTAAMLIAFLGVGLMGMHENVSDEVDAAKHLSDLVAVLGRGPHMSDDMLLSEFRRMNRRHHLRHLSIELRRADGSLLLATGSEEPPELLRSLLQMVDQEPDATVNWHLERPVGPPWQVQLVSTPGSEQREALTTLGGTLGLMLAGAVGLLVSLHLTLRSSMRPLGELLGAINALGQDNHATLRHLAPMPVTELEAIADALRLLDAELHAAHEHSRQLSQKMLRLQEDERSRIAHDLHDELGQRLTAMRVDAANLLRGLPEHFERRAGLLRMQEHCELLQRDVRTMLSALQPFGPTLQADEPVPALQLRLRLQALVDGWHRQLVERMPAIDLHWHIETAPDADLHPSTPSSNTSPAELHIDRALALTLFRVTQEALTNIARHSQAGQASVEIRLTQDPRVQLREVYWRVDDDGVGMPAPNSIVERGNGLAGIMQRIFASGGQLKVAPLRAGHLRPGVSLTANWTLR